MQKLYNKDFWRDLRHWLSSFQGQIKKKNRIRPSELNTKKHTWGVPFEAGFRVGLNTQSTQQLSLSRQHCFSDVHLIWSKCSWWKISLFCCVWCLQCLRGFELHSSMFYSEQSTMHTHTDTATHTATHILERWSLVCRYINTSPNKRCIQRHISSCNITETQVF